MLLIIALLSVLATALFAYSANQKGYPVLKIAIYPMLLGFIAIALGATVILIGQRFMSNEQMQGLFSVVVQFMSTSLYLTVLYRFWSQVKSLPHRK